MSRIGKLPIPVPGGVKAELSGSTLKVTGSKGTLTQDFDPKLGIEIGEAEIVITRADETADTRAKHGLTRALINNMIIGVSDGFTRELEIHGVGYRASLEGKSLKLQLGHSHPVNVVPPAGIEFALDGNTKIKVIGIDKQLVGQVAADVRKWRKPEPYKGKGVRYKDEYVRRKVGKAGTK